MIRAAKAPDSAGSGGGGRWPRALGVARRETRSLFEAPSGYLIVGIFWLVAGLMMFGKLVQFELALQALAKSGQMARQPQGLHINDYVVRPFLYDLGSVLIFFVPLLTMKSFAEERRSGNLELLLSMPLRGGDVLLGKFLGSLASLGICLSVLLVQAAILALASTPDWPAALTGFLGLLLLGILFTAVGVFLSVLSRSQAEAAVLSLGVLLMLVIGPDVILPAAGLHPAAVDSLSLMARFEDFTRGVLDPGHVAFFLGLSLLALAGALRSLDLVRWQG